MLFAACSDDRNDRESHDSSLTKVDDITGFEFRMNTRRRPVHKGGLGQDFVFKSNKSYVFGQGFDTYHPLYIVYQFLLVQSIVSLID